MDVPDWAGGGPTPAVVSGGGHGYINGHGSLEGGQLSPAEAAAFGRTVERDITTAPGAAGGHAATCAAELERQRTKKLPSLVLSTGLMS